jgi:2-phospho-L-lactate/phosphoenolpyruvate guanylyltransferase
MTSTYALIPAKELAGAKARLTPILDDAARRELTIAMLRDVLAAAMACRALAGVTIVSLEQRALAIARQAGADGTSEAGGLNEALTSAAENMREGGAGRLLVLAADLPLADSESIDAVLAADADVTLVPSRDGGTSALALAPDAIEFQFGPDSARKHLAAAEEAGLRTSVLALPRLAFDVDKPEDLEELRTRAGELGRHTREALERMGLLAATR